MARRRPSKCAAPVRTPAPCQEKDDQSVGTIVGGATQNSGKSAGMPWSKLLSCRDWDETLELKDCPFRPCRAGCAGGGASFAPGQCCRRALGGLIKPKACRKSGITTLDVDVVECHGSGRFIADAIEVPEAANVECRGESEARMQCVRVRFAYARLRTYAACVWV